MKNQYFGDINDYKKYGLIRQLGSVGIKTMICWMLTPPNDRTKNEGLQTQYLNNPDKWQKYDKLLFKYLQKRKSQILSNLNRNVSLIEKENILPKCKFFDDVISDNREQRNQYFQKLFQKSDDVDLIFFDPDIGIETFVKCGNKNSSQYLYWNEVKAAYDKGFSILVYQHRHRAKTVDEMAEYLQCKAQEQFARDRNVFVYKTPSVLFLLITRNNHRQSVVESSKKIGQTWVDVLNIHR